MGRRRTYVTGEEFEKIVDIQYEFITECVRLADKMGVTRDSLIADITHKINAILETTSLDSEEWRDAFD